MNLSFVQIGALFFSLLLFLPCESEECSERSRLIQAVLTGSADLLEKKYDMRIAGDTARSTEDGLCLLGLIFDNYKKLSKEEIRLVLVKSSLDFIDLINSNKDISFYASDYPFTFKNISISVYFKNEDGSDVSPPDIGVATASSSGYLIYENFDADDYSNTFFREKESFEEALRILEKSGTIEKKAEGVELPL
jgi:hypothetical protein